MGWKLPYTNYFCLKTVLYYLINRLCVSLFLPPWWGKPQGRFSVDPETGAIVVTERLDREEQESYTLILEAWDNYRVGYSAGESRNAFQQVT